MGQWESVDKTEVRSGSLLNKRLCVSGVPAGRVQKEKGEKEEMGGRRRNRRSRVGSDMDLVRRYTDE